MSDRGWSDDVAEIAAAAMTLEGAAAQTDQMVEELAAILTACLPEACEVERSNRGRGPVRRLRVLTGERCFTCRRRPGGGWETAVATLRENVIGAPQTVGSGAWAKALATQLRRLTGEQEQLSTALRGLLGS